MSRVLNCSTACVVGKLAGRWRPGSASWLYQWQRRRGGGDGRDERRQRRGAAALKPNRPVVFTAAMVKRVVSESRSAMAHSGQATISYRSTDNGKVNGQGADHITLAGKNWNDVIFEGRGQQGPMG